MRRLAYLTLATWMLACGGVTESGDGDGDGDAGIECGGTLDMDGNCVCPARLVPPACDTCAEGWEGGACAVFNDAFDRADGPLGPRYETGLGVVDDATIAGNRACGDEQALALLAEGIDSRNLTASFLFEAGGEQGQEVSLAVTDSAALGDPTNIFIAGCDGGDGACTLRISDTAGTVLAQLPTPITLTPGQLFRFEFFVDGSQNYGVTVFNDGQEMLGQLDAKLPDGYTVLRLGAVVGRQQDDLLSCIDDLTVEVL